ncbi:Hypp8856 [Branchiostoma lanceolatum]|uniref:Hypp8856 protein n=1 Tax=Branchiostoma lanceolatum TaxID=7740 RepID=A0A8J9Z9M1_BRALA|nr:Hypp8856 [Branchiostoma lanceolatum]
MSEIKEDLCGLSRDVTLAVLPRLYMEEVVTELGRRNISTDAGATGNCRERLLGILQDVMEQEYHRADTGASSDLDALQMPHVGTTPGSSPQNSMTVISLPSRVPVGTSHVQATTSVPCNLLDLEEEDFGIEGREQTQSATEKHSDDDDGMAAAAVPVSVTVSENVSWSVSSKNAETARTISERETHCGLNAQHAHSCSLKQEPIDQNRDGTSENMIDRCQHCSCSSRRSPAFPTVMAEDLLASFGNALEQGQSENMVFVVHELVKQVAENRRAIQEIRDQQQQRLEEPSVSGGQEELEVENGSRRKRRKTKHKLPDKCRDNVRKIYKALLEGDNDFNGFNFNETLTSRYNQRVLQTLHSEITREYGGEQRCPFSPMEVKDAAKRYYRSQKDDRVRRDKGRLTAHRNAMRKEQRLTQKVHRRRRALEKCQHSWTDRTKKMAAEILAKQYQSSESSGDESQDPPRFTVRRLPWESEALRRLKDSLDEVCPQRGAARVLSTDLSDRTVPDGTPAWAVKGVYQGDLDEGMSDSLED